MAEVQLGKLATEKASSADVKQFGQRMADDHGKALDELKTLAQSKNITLPTTSTRRTRRWKRPSRELSGAAFDRAYMQAMVDDHRNDVSEFRPNRNPRKDPE